MSERTRSLEGAVSPETNIPRRHAAQFPHSDLTRTIIGGLYEVHGELGGGFLERVYANALTMSATYRPIISPRK